MPTEVDPSTTDLTTLDLSKLNKKDLAKHLSALQVRHVELGKKYSM
jgi:hypothetical protein